jgi:hypothetical protein
MKKQDTRKKVWTKPAINTLSIKKDTFSGISYGNEKASGKGKIPTP